MILPILIFLISALVIWNWNLLQVDGLPRWMSASAFMLKCVAGIALCYLYTNVIDIDRSEADIFKYYDDGIIMRSSADESPSTFIRLFLDKDGEDLDPYYASMFNWDRSYSLIQLNDNRTVIRLHALLALVTNGNIIGHVIFFNLLAFIGLLFLFKGFREFIQIEGWTFIVVCIMPPSLLFWGSGLLKESLVLLPLGISLYGASAMYCGNVGKMAFLTGIILFCFIKPYVFLSLCPVFLYLFVRRLLDWKAIGSAIAVVILCSAGLAISTAFPSMDIVGILALKQRDFIHVAMMSDAGSLVDIPRIENFSTLVLNAPEALFRTFLRPGLWEIRSGMDGLAAIENTGYILLILCAVAFRKKDLNADVLMVCFLFLLGMGVLIGSVTPVLGAIVRYKVPALPFLMLAMIHIVDFNTLKRPFI